MIVPDLWLEALSAVQAHSPAILAGGALRDLDHGHSVKDLDIFIHADNFEEFQWIVSEIHRANPSWNLSPALDVSHYLREWNPEVIGVSTEHPTVDLGRPPIQIIGLSIPVSRVLARFDIGICQIGHDGNHVCFTDNYFRDKQGRKLTITRYDTADQRAYTKRRLERLSDRYPWPVRNPEVLE